MHEEILKNQEAQIRAAEEIEEAAAVLKEKVEKYKGLKEFNPFLSLYEEYGIVERQNEIVNPFLKEFPMFESVYENRLKTFAPGAVWDLATAILSYEYKEGNKEAIANDEHCTPEDIKNFEYYKFEISEDYKNIEPEKRIKAIEWAKQVYYSNNLEENLKVNKEKIYPVITEYYRNTDKANNTYIMYNRALENLK